MFIPICTIVVFASIVASAITGMKMEPIAMGLFTIIAVFVDSTFAQIIRISGKIRELEGMLKAAAKREDQTAQKAEAQASEWGE